MLRIARSLFVVLLGVLSTAGPASAETPAQAAARWGLLGTWRLDCTTPASQANQSFTFAVREGRLFQDRNLGGDAQDSSPMTQATIRPDGKILLTTVFSGGTREAVFMKSDDGRRRRVMSNRGVDTDEYTIRDGLYVSNGQPTPWSTRCN
ncbi:MAG: hypothetical protein NTV97_03715 [Alphaproteobacteria bacterium]|nr:hypothetical protein [Alphaproteobacteria bacterium]